MPPLRFCALVVSLVLGVASAEAEDAYRLGPQDQLEVKVSDLRSGTGEAYQYLPFTGQFTVAPSGRVSLPLVGELQASGRTTSDLSADIAARLQAKVGLAEKPDASVQVIKFRPFYVMGSVDKPGEYEFRPDLTVLQAVSLAGGLERVTNDALLGYARDAMTSRGDVRLWTVTRYALLARQTRLDAEINGDATVGIPATLRGRENDPDIARILREERMLFEARRSGLQAQVDALTQTKTFLLREIDQLAIKDQTVGHQLEASRKELEQITGLVSKGLTVLPRQLELEQSTAQLESNRLDVQLAAIRAREDISKTDRDALDLKNTRRNDALQEASEVRNKLSEATEKLETAENLVLQLETRAPAATMAATQSVSAPDYMLTRRVNGKSETRTAQEDDLVQPGDVVRVVPKIAGADATAQALQHAASTF